MYIVNYENAVDGLQIGEVVLYSLLMAAQEKISEPSIGLSVVNGLSKLNLYNESKSIAIEILCHIITLYWKMI